jgi:hypothetical protein
MLYHYQVGIPAHIKLPRHVVPLLYSNHALREAKSDKVAHYNLPILKTIDLEDCQVIEVEVVNDEAIKWVVRKPLDGLNDYVLVLVPMPGNLRWYVKTVWVNTVEDGHSTLDASRYDKPVEREYFFA